MRAIAQTCGRQGLVARIRFAAANRVEAIARASDNYYGESAKTG